MSRLIISIGALSLFAVAWPLEAQDEERPQKVDICVLLANPGNYDHKLVRVAGQVSRGFEDFTLRGTSCGDSPPLWLEYGGAQPAEVTYCCVGEQSHPPNGKDPLWVEGIETSLKRDAAFKRFDVATKQLQRGETVDATLIGRVFSTGSYTTDSGETVEVGYGHFGIFSLLVIQKVVKVAR